MPDLAAGTLARVRALIEPHRNRPGALLPVLHALHEEFGHVDPAAVPLLAEALDRPAAEIDAVIDFYADFRRTRPGRHRVRVCIAEACRARGAESLLTALIDRLEIDPGATTEDGRFTLETVHCLGNCALGPAALVDRALHGRLSSDRLDSLLRETAP